VGVDYFSTLAYLPSLANELAGPLAPLAVAGVIAATLLLALPAYVYVIGRSSDGRGATGLLQRSIFGWRGKFIMLVMMGFVAADFIITRSLSTSDAAVHLLANPHLHAAIDQHAPSHTVLHQWLSPGLAERVTPYWNRQVGTTLLLTLISIGFWFYFAGGFTRRVLHLTAWVVGVYMAATLAILIRCGIFLWDNPERLETWWREANFHSASAAEGVIVLLLLIFPQLALGISGFELSMTVVPLISGDKKESADPELQDKRRVRRARYMMLALTVIMGFFLLASTVACSVLIPNIAFKTEQEAQHRALAYLAHGPLFPDWFGTFYDLSTAIILCLAGVSVTVGLRDLVPAYLHRLGMELTWARKYGLFLLLCNGIILLATLVFRASVEAQEGAYATSVLVLLAGANLAAAADLRRRFHVAWPFLSAPFALSLAFFLVMAGVIVWRQPGGLVLSAAFLGLVFVTSLWSRWHRSLELRFSGFTFADEESKKRWQDLCGVAYEILVPHRPGHFSVSKKNDIIRETFRIPPDVPVIFIEAELGDTSEFDQAPLMRIYEQYELEVIHVSKCSSIAHVIAAIALEFSKVGRPPEVIFGWSHESPLAANLNFLFFGQGNVPWMVQELVRRVEPDEAKRPRVVIG
jgi:hypothetical protein